MSVCKPILRELFAEDPEGWAKNLKVKTPLIQKLVSGSGTIHADTAEAMTHTINQKTGLGKNIDDFFELSELKGREIERTVTYTYGSGRPISKDEWVSYFRYLYEKRMRGHNILDVLVVAIVLSLILFVYWFFTK